VVLKSLELVILNRCSVGFPGRRAKVYAELVGFNEHTRAGPPSSTEGRQPVAEVEAAGTLSAVLWDPPSIKFQSRTNRVFSKINFFS